ncbi:MAG: T9SS type B sorting domain-containing protein [Cryomorphaceae bacterium]|nr:T9SS type B sorting domain-containing protein [Cryomorphaceae bacterium]
MSWITNIGIPASIHCGEVLANGKIVYGGGYDGTLGSTVLPDNGGGIADGLVYGAAVAAQFSSDGSTMEWMAMLGGSADYSSLIGIFLGLAVDELTGRIYLINQSSSDSFPITEGAYMDLPSPNVGDSKYYICAINSEGSELLHSSYLPFVGRATRAYNYGSFAQDYYRYLSPIKTDGNSIFFSWNFLNHMDDLTFDIQLGETGQRGCGVFSMDMELSTMNWSTGYSSLAPTAVPAGVVDLILLENGDLAMCGHGWAPGLPTSENAYDSSFEGAEEAWVATVDHFTGELKNLTYFGSTGKEQAWRLAETANGIAVFGKTDDASGYPEAQAAWGNGRMWVAEFDTELTTLLSHYRIGWEEPIEGIDDLAPRGIDVDECGFIYLFAVGFSYCPPPCVGLSGLPLTSNAIQETGTTYLAVLNTVNHTLQYGGCFGGSSVVYYDRTFFQYDSSQIVIGTIVNNVDLWNGLNELISTPGAFASSAPEFESPDGSFLLKLDFSDMPSGWTTAALQAEIIDSNCSSSAVSLSSTSSGLVYTWSTNGDSQQTEEGNLLLEFPSGTIQNIQLIVSDSTTCNGADSTMLELMLPAIFSTLQVAATSEARDSCAVPQTIPFSFTGSGATSMSWQVNGLEVSNEESFDLQINSPGEYLIELTALDEVCDSTSQVQFAFEFFEPLAAEAEVIVTPSSTCAPSGLLAYAEGSGITGVEWFFANEFLSDQDQVEFQSSHEGQVSLLCVVANEHCQTTDSLHLLIDLPEVESFSPFEVPNIFSPQNDGVNDVLKLIANEGFEEVTNMQFNLYNRWGVLVYTTNKHLAWDGSTNGEPLADGTYFYELRYQLPCLEGVQTRNGIITVVR